MKPFHFLTLSTAILLFAKTNAYTVDSSTDTALHLARRELSSENDVNPASSPQPMQEGPIAANMDASSSTVNDQDARNAAAPSTADVQAGPSSKSSGQQRPDFPEEKSKGTVQDVPAVVQDAAPERQKENDVKQDTSSLKQDSDSSKPKTVGSSKKKNTAKPKHGPEEEKEKDLSKSAQPSPPATQPPIAPTAPSPPAVPAPAVDGPHPSVVVQDEDNFCMFLPPQPGMDVATHEDFGIPFCSRKGMAGDNQEFPEDFVTKKHVESTSAYIQVTGYIDPTKYGLLSTDQGGQYDNHGNGKPIGAQCQGWKYFVNLLEPANQRFCIRCCKSKVDCNTGRSEYGCPRVVPGDYTDFDLVADVLEVLVTEDTPTTAIPLGQHVQSFIDTVVASGDANVSKRSWSAFIDGLMNQYINHQDLIGRVAQTTAGITSQDDWVKYCNDLKGIVDLPSENL